METIQPERSKRRTRLRMFVLSAFFLSLIIGWPFYAFFKPLIQLANLEQNTKKVITASELQQWATNLIATYPPDQRFTRSELLATLPPQLKKLAPKMGPHVNIYHSENPGTQSYVFLYWGSGFAGHAAFEIGPTNFTGYRSTNMWAPGVYFWDENRRKPE